MASAAERLNTVHMHVVVIRIGLMYVCIKQGVL